MTKYLVHAAVDVSKKNIDTKNLYMSSNVSATKQPRGTFTTEDYDNTNKGKTSFEDSIKGSNNNIVSLLVQMEQPTDFQEGKGNSDKQIKNILHGKSLLMNVLLNSIHIIAINRRLIRSVFSK